MSTPLWTDSDWTFELIEKTWHEIDKIAKKELRVSHAEPQIEIISSSTMLDLYSTIGMPMYNHWSYGKQLVIDEAKYNKGHMGLAYEIVVNRNPLVTYLMENNTMTMQALVLAHSISGHGHFFFNNYLFKYWTDPAGISSYLAFAKQYIEKQEEEHGLKTVEEWIDSCHALMEYGVNTYKRPGKLSLEKEKERQQERIAYQETQVNEFYSLIPEKKTVEKQERFPKEPEENLLYFFEKYSPDIKDWQREILRIVRKTSQYYAPQKQTKIFNEGTASYIHYTIMNRLHEKGLTTDGAHLEFLSSHTGVLWQPPYNSKYFNGFNPYALGFAILKDIERMCHNPTEEDLFWFPQIKNTKDHMDIILDAIENYRDESLLRQWLSPNIMRKFGMFELRDDKNDKENYHVLKIHNDSGYQDLRTSLANYYEKIVTPPKLEVVNVDRKTRTLYLEYTPIDNRKLDNIEKMVPHIKRLWGGYDVIIKDKKGYGIYPPPPPIDELYV